VKSKKICKICQKLRDISFFETPKSLYCIDCKKKAKRVKKKQSKSYINKKKDKEWAEAVKERDGHRCQYCGKTTFLNSHHIFSRSNFLTRWDLDNGITLCSGCHTLSSKFSAHKTPIEFIDWLIDKKGQDFINKLRATARKTTKTTNSFII